jgi:hypothetical protein
MHHAALVANAVEPTGGGWTQRVGAYTALPSLIRQLGADPVATLRAAGLSQDALDLPDAHVPYASLGRLLHLASERTGCRHLGMLAGRLWHLEDIGLVGELVRHSPTVGDALRTLTVYQHLNSGGGLAFLIERPGIVEIGTRSTTRTSRGANRSTTGRSPRRRTSWYARKPSAPWERSAVLVMPAAL